MIQKVVRRLASTRLYQKHPSQDALTLFRSTRLQCYSSTQGTMEQQLTSRGTQSQRLSYIPASLHSRNYSTQDLPAQGSSHMSHEPIIHPIFEPTTGTFQYIVTDPSSKATVIIDPVLDFEPTTQTITTTSADTILSLVAESDYKVEYVLETHAHADHLSAASYLQAQLSRSQGHAPLVGIGKRIGQVQRLFGKRYGVSAAEYEVVFDKLLEDDEVFHVGNMDVKAIHLPGHTPDHMGYSIGSNIFCGDSLFHIDIGTARTDFPGGSAHDLWQSSQRLLSCPNDTKIWIGHDYPSANRTVPVPFMTVKQHKEANKHVKSGVTEDRFVKARKERDAALKAPRLLHQSLQINVRGGRLPSQDDNGKRMLVVPLELKGVEGW